MSSLCRFVLPSTLSPFEEACVAEFNEYKKRMKELSQQKSTAKRLPSSSGGGLTTNSSTSDHSQQQQESARNPEQAKEAAKKLVQSGAIKVHVQGKDQGFKRASSSSVSGSEKVPTKKLGLTPNPSTPSANQSNPFQPIPFVSASSTPKFVNNTSSHENKRRVVNYDDTEDFS